ncbi:MAG: pyridoxamine 5'-phosphate oxidase [Steroidobacteraceae bacterium]|nr:pyridoxamine 5'-phosphate oxidase [Steroidobacteraceae bacterium]
MTTPSELLPDPLPSEPLAIVADWLEQAWRAKRQPNPNAMVLATATADGRPAARVVLCKGLQPDPGFLVFYTNYESRKGRELAGNPRAALVLHWDYLQRQVRVEGPVVKAPESDSDAYFASRPLESRVGAWASQQSQPIESRARLLEAVKAAAQRFGVTPGQKNASAAVPRPPHWGGFRLWADTVELWVEGDARIHDRARWTRTLTPQGADQFSATPWSATRLQP